MIRLPVSLPAIPRLILDAKINEHGAAVRIPVCSCHPVSPRAYEGSDT